MRHLLIMLLLVPMLGQSQVIGQDVVALRDYVDARFAEQTRATDLARMAMDYRLESMNEFRAQITMERADYVTRDLLVKHLDAVEIRLDGMERYQANLEGRLWMLGGVLAVVNVLTFVGSIIWQNTVTQTKARSV